MSDNNEKEVGYTVQNAEQLGSVGVADIFSDIGRSLDNVAEQLQVSFIEIISLKERVNRLCIVCTLLAGASVAQWILLIWK